MLSSLFKLTTDKFELYTDRTDEEFDRIYPRSIRRLSDQHFTPLSVAKRAAAFLVREPGTRVLDIGSGAGKFCFVGAVTTEGNFTGVEQRQELVNLSNAIASSAGINNVSFVNTNVIGISFNDFDAFYLFNPFYENVKSRERMDDAVLTSPSLFASYSAHTKNQLSSMPDGTRLATYYTSRSIIPSSFKLIEASDDDHLLFWEKQSNI